MDVNMGAHIRYEVEFLWVPIAIGSKGKSIQSTMMVR